MTSRLADWLVAAVYVWLLVDNVRVRRRLARAERLNEALATGVIRRWLQDDPGFVDEMRAVIRKQVEGER